MSPYFILSNVHFAQEIFGALVFFVIAWLAFDAFFVRRDFVTASRGLGFAFLAFGQVAHGLVFQGTQLEGIGYGVKIFGLALVALNLLLERPVKKPSLHAGFLAPSGFFLTYGDSIVSALYFIIALLSFQQYRNETKKAIKPFWVGFLLLFIGSLFVLWQGSNELQPAWIAGQIFEIVGFISLAVWVWQYLSLRLQEEVVLVFVGLAFLISTSVTLAFSMILVNQIEIATKANLLSGARTIAYSLAHTETALGEKASALATDVRVGLALRDNDFGLLETIGRESLSGGALGTVAFTDAEGRVVLRVNAVTQREDSLAGRSSLVSALSGAGAHGIEPGENGGLALWASEPVQAEGELVGTVVFALPLDAAFVDGVRKSTDLDAVVIAGETVSAATALGSDARTRIEGVTITDPAFKSAVIEKGQFFAGQLEMRGRQFLSGAVPLKGADGSVLGALGVVRASEDVARLVTKTNLLTLLSVAGIVLLLIVPIYFVTRRLLEE